MIKLKLTVSDLNLLLDYFSMVKKAIQTAIKTRKRFTPEHFLHLTELFELQVMTTKFQIKRINMLGNSPSKKLTMCLTPTQGYVFMKYNTVFEQTKSSTALTTNSTAIILNYSGFIHNHFINLK